MSLPVAQAAIHRRMRGLHDNDELEISFHGGEPFLEFTLVRDLCEWIWSQEWPVPYICFATTNGTLIHGEVRDWLYRNRRRFWVGLSLDGTKLMHDLNRSNSFDRIDIGFFRESWPSQPVKMTISDRTLRYLAAGIIELQTHGFKVNANLAYGVDWSSDSTAVEFVHQLETLVDFYLQHPEYEPSGPLAMMIAAITPPTEAPKKWCGVGTDIVAVDTDGAEYPCQMFVPMGTPSTREARSVDWRSSSAVRDKLCRECPIERICPTCYGDNLLSRGDVSMRDAKRCRLMRIQALACSALHARRLAGETPAKSTPAEAASAIRLLAAIEEIQASFASRVTKA